MVTAKRRLQKLEALHDATERRRITQLTATALAAEVETLNARGRADRAAWFLSVATDAQLEAIANSDNYVETHRRDRVHMSDSPPTSAER